MPFTSCGGCLKNIFITEAEIIDRYVGNQLWLWGCSAAYQLGNNSSTSRSSPVQTVSTATNWKQVSLGFLHSAAIKTDGTLWLWGTQGSSGAIGRDPSIAQEYRSPVQTISAGNNWKQVSLGVYHSTAVKTDGTLWTWGCGSLLQLGLGQAEAGNFFSPVQTISAGNNWKQVDAGYYHTAGVKTDGTLWLWGDNSSRQLGSASSCASIGSPVQTVAGGTNWKQVSLGGCFSAAIKTDGTLWLWGSGACGQLGENVTTTSRSSPVQTISAGTNWKQVSLGACHVGAIKTDGTLWTWGTVECAGIGDNTNIRRSSPVQTVSGGTNWKQVSAGHNGTAAVKTDGSLWIWGSPNAGRNGDNAVIGRSSPVQTVSGGTNWKQAAVSKTDTSTSICPFSAAITYTES